MRILLTFIIAALFASCGTSSNQEATSNEPVTGSEQKEVVVEEEEKTEESSTNLLLGTWTFEDTKLKVVQIITYKEDGTYSMKMGPVDIEGTWELNDNILITKSRPDAPGQKKTITKLDESSLWTIWEPKDGKARELKYIRK